ncbi:MAG: hypothetical protein JWL59_3439 [Chthoniobacteraceae bacterium]|nr:hypothetical protein [Chthoniobacteraceae bacterium]
MAALRIVKALDEVEYSDLSFGKSLEVGAIDAFGFDHVPEGLGHGVVITVSFAAFLKSPPAAGVAKLPL